MHRKLVSPRLRFADAPPATGEAAPVGGAVVTPPAETPAVAAPPAETPPSGELPDDPAVLKAEIAKLRKENGAERTNAKTKAADDARAELTDKLAIALGIKKEGEKPTAEQLTKELTEQQTTAKTAVTELAIYKAAGANGASPDALLDSRAFLASVAELDPASADFQKQVGAAIKKAVTDNPKLKAAPVAGASAVDHAGGTGELADIDAQIAAALKAGDIQKSIKLKQQKAAASRG